jgi:hypothetical protein
MPSCRHVAILPAEFVLAALVAAGDGADVPQPGPDIVPTPGPHPVPPPPPLPPEIIEPPFPEQHPPVREPIVPGEPLGRHRLRRTGP